MPRITIDPLSFPITKLTMEQKVERVQRLCGRFPNWSSNLKHRDCRAVVKFLHKTFTYNLIPMTHWSDLTDDMIYVSNTIINPKRIDTALIIFHVMIEGLEAKYPTRSIPFPILITKLMTDAKVPFKVVMKGGRAGPAVGYGTLQRMSLMTNDGGLSSATPLQPAPHRVRSATVKLTMMDLLQGLMRKVS